MLDSASIRRIWPSAPLSIYRLKASAQTRKPDASKSARGTSATSRDRQWMAAFGREAEARRLLSVPMYEFTAYEFKDLPNRDYPLGDDRHRLYSSY
jgi:hypothetical protein